MPSGKTCTLFDVLTSREEVMGVYSFVRSYYYLKCCVLSGFDIGVQELYRAWSDLDDFFSSHCF